ncbi:TWiK family of potassium channels protein 7 [Nymphon striatum]|nr:TWiK family of potassium channels protein 7 [Nymphon striatum]
MKRFKRKKPDPDAENDETLTVGKLFLRFLFSYFGLFLLVVGYSVFGAWIFLEIEGPAEELRREKKIQTAVDINTTLYFIADRFYETFQDVQTEKEWKDLVRDQLKNFEMYIVKSVEEVNYDGNIYSWDYDWELMKALLYSITITSTIGYGHIYPKTNLGMIVTMLYATVGIPLMLVFLANIGDGMAKAFRYAYSRMCCRWCRSKRKQSEFSQFGKNKKKVKSLSEEMVGDEDYMPTNKVIVPIIMNLILITIYIVLGAVLFSYWEGWDLVSASYFTFVTFSTIGFGDLVPGNSFLDLDDFTSKMQMLACCVYVLLGMAMLTMCINLMQEQIVYKVKYVAKEIGLIKKKKGKTRAKKNDEGQGNGEENKDLTKEAIKLDIP